MEINKKFGVSLDAVKRYLKEHGPSFPSAMAIDLNTTTPDVVRAITYLERKPELTLYIGGRFGLYDPSVGKTERKQNTIQCQQRKTKKQT